MAASEPPSSDLSVEQLRRLLEVGRGLGEPVLEAVRPAPTQGAWREALIQPPVCDSGEE